MTEKKLKVCFVSLYSPKVVGGVGSYLTTLGDGLREKGIESILITKKIDGLFPTNPRLYEISFKGQRFIRSIYFYIKILYTIFKLRNEISIINVQTQYTISLIVAIFGKFIRIPVVTTIHGPPASIRKTMKIYHPSLIEKLVLKSSNIVIFIDEQGKIDYGLKTGIVIENGVDSKRLVHDSEIRDITRKKFVLENKFVIIFVGHAVLVKGISDLIESFLKVKENYNNIFIIILSPITDYILENRFAELGIIDHILIQEVKDVYEFLCAADLFVLPSYGEGLSLSMLEAMSCSLPVIMTDVGGTPYVIKDRVNGLLIKPGDIDELTKKILWCIEHEKERKELGLNARMTIEKNHDIKKVVDRYINVYEQLL